VLPEYILNKKTKDSTIHSSSFTFEKDTPMAFENVTEEEYKDISQRIEDYLDDKEEGHKKLASAINQICVNLVAECVNRKNERKNEEIPLITKGELTDGLSETQKKLISKIRGLTGKNRSAVIESI